MDFQKFGKLPIELKVTVIRKLESVAYARFRRTCRVSDEICEMNTARIIIYCRKSLNLTGNFLSIRDKKSFRITDDNISQISRSISGFAFASAYVSNTFPEQPADKKDVHPEPGLISCLQATAGLLIRKVTMCEMPIAHMKMILNAWKPKKVEIYLKGRNKEENDVLEIMELKTIESVCYNFVEGYSDRILDELMDNKNKMVKIVFLKEIQQASTVWDVVNKIIKNLMNPSHGSCVFSLHLAYNGPAQFNVDLAIGFLYTEGMLYLGSFSRTEMGYHNTFKKWDIWINNGRSDGKYLLITIKRSNWLERISENALIEMAENREELLSKLQQQLLCICKDQPVDMSAFYEAKGLEDIKKIFDAVCQQRTEVYQIQCYDYDDNE